MLPRVGDDSADDEEQEAIMLKAQEDFLQKSEIPAAKVTRVSRVKATPTPAPLPHEDTTATPAPSDPATMSMPFTSPISNVLSDVVEKQTVGFAKHVAPAPPSLPASALLTPFPQAVHRVGTSKFALARRAKAGAHAPATAASGSTWHRPQAPDIASRTPVQPCKADGSASPHTANADSTDSTAPRDNAIDALNQQRLKNMDPEALDEMKLKNVSPANLELMRQRAKKEAGAPATVGRLAGTSCQSSSQGAPSTCRIATIGGLSGLPSAADVDAQNREEINRMHPSEVQESLDEIQGRMSASMLEFLRKRGQAKERGELPPSGAGAGAGGGAVGQPTGIHPPSALPSSGEPPGGLPLVPPGGGDEAPPQAGSRKLPPARLNALATAARNLRPGSGKGYVDADTLLGTMPAAARAASGPKPQVAAISAAPGPKAGSPVGVQHVANLTGTAATAPVATPGGPGGAEDVVDPRLVARLRFDLHEAAGGPVGVQHVANQTGTAATAPDATPGGPGGAEDVVDPRLVARLRFDLHAAVVGLQPADEKTVPDQVLNRDSLRQDEGSVPDGYTVGELLLLARSTMSNHRAAAMRMLGDLLRHARSRLAAAAVLGTECENVPMPTADAGGDASAARGGEPQVSWQEVWDYSVHDLAVVPHLRLALDDEHPPVVLEAVRAVAAVVCGSCEEAWVSELADSFPATGWPSVRATFLTRSHATSVWESTSRVHPAAERQLGNNEDMTPEDVAAVLEGFRYILVVKKVLERFRYILVVMKVPGAIPSILSALVAFARDSSEAAEAVVRCPHMLDVLKTLVSHSTEQSAALAAAEPGQITPPAQSDPVADEDIQVLAVLLFRVLCQSSPVAAHLIRASGAMFLVHSHLLVQSPLSEPPQGHGSAGNAAPASLTAASNTKAASACDSPSPNVASNSQEGGACASPPPNAASSSKIACEGDSLSPVDASHSKEGSPGASLSPNAATDPKAATARRDDNASKAEVTQKLCALEALRLWRVCAHQGVSPAMFEDVYPYVVHLLSPPRGDASTSTHALLHWHLSRELYLLLHALLLHALAIQGGDKTLGLSMLQPGTAAALAQDSWSAWLHPSDGALKSVSLDLVSDCNITCCLSSGTFESQQLHPALLMPPSHASSSGFAAAVNFLATYWSSLDNAKPILGPILAAVHGSGLGHPVELTAVDERHDQATHGMDMLSIALLWSPPVEDRAGSGAAAAAGSHLSLGSALTSFCLEAVEQLPSTVNSHPKQTSAIISHPNAANLMPLSLQVSAIGLLQATNSLPHLSSDIKHPKTPVSISDVRTIPTLNSHILESSAKYLVSQYRSCTADPNSLATCSKVLNPWQNARMQMLQHEITLFLASAAVDERQIQRSSGQQVHTSESTPRRQAGGQPGRDVLVVDASLSILALSPPGAEAQCLAALRHAVSWSRTATGQDAAFRTLQQMSELNPSLAVAAGGPRRASTPAFPCPSSIPNQALSQVLFDSYSVSWLSMVSQERMGEAAAQASEEKQKHKPSATFLNEVEGSRLPAPASWLFMEVIPTPTKERCAIHLAYLFEARELLAKDARGKGGEDEMQWREPLARWALAALTHRYLFSGQQGQGGQQGEVDLPNAWCSALFAERLCEHLCNDCFGDPLLATIVATLLLPGVQPGVQRTGWTTLAQARALHLLPTVDLCLGLPSQYLENRRVVSEGPLKGSLETPEAANLTLSNFGVVNVEMVDTMVRSLCDGDLKKALEAGEGEADLSVAAAVALERMATFLLVQRWKMRQVKSTEEESKAALMAHSLARKILMACPPATVIRMMKVGETLGMPLQAQAELLVQACTSGGSQMAERLRRVLVLGRLMS
eukprot:gene22911-30090_t